MLHSLLDIPSSVISSIPAKFARLYSAVPIGLKDNILTLAIADDTDYKPRADISALYNFETRYVKYPADEILRAIEVLYSGEGPIIKSTDQANDLDPETAANAAPTVRLVNTLLMEGVIQGASDIHLEPFRERVVLRFRIDGLLVERPSLSINSYQAVVSRIKLMANLNIAEKRLPQDGRFTMNTEKGPLDIRVTVSPVVYGECIAIRLLNQRNTKLEVEKLGINKQERSLLRRWTSRGNGIVLVTGPTGSGKTTTLYAALSELATPAVNIITIEDPVEYQIDGVNQMEVKTGIGFTFANGLRTILRMDPDIIMVGEIRDQETAQIAVQSALTGHLVLSTLHTNNAPSTIIRLSDMGIEPYLVASTVRGIIAQRLVRVLCKDCKMETTIERPTASEISPALKPHLSGNDPIKAYRPVGCSQCLGTGFKGRTGIYEFLDITDEIAMAISKRSTERDLKDIAISQGMQGLSASGLSKVLDGTTCFEELLRVTRE